MYIAFAYLETAVDALEKDLARVQVMSYGEIALVEDHWRVEREEINKPQRAQVKIALFKENVESAQTSCRKELLRRLVSRHDKLYIFKVENTLVSSHPCESNECSIVTRAVELYCRLGIRALGLDEKRRSRRPVHRRNRIGSV